MELVRENILLNRHIGRERSQMLLEGDIIVPDVKPDIASVLKVTARVAINKANANMGRISFSGQLVVDALYLANVGGEISVHSISARNNIDDFLNMEGVAPHMWLNLDANLENIEHHIVNDRKLNYRVVVDIQAQALDNQNFEAVRSISDLPESQQKMAFLTMNNMVSKQVEQFTIRDEIVLPSAKPAIRELLQANINIVSREITMAAGRVDISGDLLITPLYKGFDSESIIDFADFELPFSGSLDVEAAREGVFSDVRLSLADHLIEIGPDADGEDRILSIEVVIAADVQISENREFSVLEDAYCIDQNLDIKTQSLDYLSLICRNRNQFSAKEIVTLSGAPEILQVLQVGGLVHLEDRRVIEDKVIVEGIVEANILYVANSDEAPVHNYRAHLPFRQVIETKGARLGMEAAITHNIDQISFNMLSGREVELRFTLSFDTLIRELRPAQLIQDIEFNPLNTEDLDNLPSMVILVAQQADSLWSVAKRYNADLEELAAINDIEPTAALAAGQKLLVVKKVAEG
ncbi:MAG: DUF3794 domain-containing protein [Clostridiales bacterium]|jgi:hypothetical protein|nr:DUF3794 domain-containing protein [Clostridiales bacterium]